MTQCKTCTDSGYVPFVKADGTISKHARLLCDICGGYDHERDYADARMLERQPEDFDSLARPY